MIGADVHAVVTQIYGIEITQIRGDEAYFSCPNPNHEDRNPSCSINLNSGAWFCFVCRAHGNLISLGSLHFKVSIGDAERIIYGKDADQAVLRHKLSQRVPRSPREAAGRPVEPPDPPERYEDGPLSSLVRRGFSAALLREWGVRYVREATIAVRKTKRNPSGEATITHSVAIPLRDEHGALVAWCYRRTDQSSDWQPRYLYSLHSPLSTLLFGFDKVSKIADLSRQGRTNAGGSVAIVEGGLDCLWLWQAEQPAVALLGSSMTSKATALDDYVVTLFFDKDEAGYRATVEVGEMLWTKTSVFVVRYPRGQRAWKDPAKRKDPADLKLQATRQALSRATSYTAWRMRRKMRRLVESNR